MIAFHIDAACWIIEWKVPTLIGASKGEYNVIDYTKAIVK